MNASITRLGKEAAQPRASGTASADRVRTPAFLPRFLRLCALTERWRRLRSRAYKSQNLSVGYPLARFWARPAALPLSWAVARTGMSPNLITSVTLLTGLVACAAFAMMNYPASLVTGTLLLFLWYLLDHVDGQVARLQGRVTAAGAYLDYYMHALIHPLASWAIACCASRAQAAPDVFSAGLPYLLPLAVLGMEAHQAAEAKTLARTGPATDRSPTSGRYRRPWRFLFAICEFPNLLPQLAALSFFALWDPLVGARALLAWTGSIGGLGLALVAGRVLLRVRNTPFAAEPLSSAVTDKDGTGGVC